jgi:hypothetical protein
LTTAPNRDGLPYLLTGCDLVEGCSEVEKFLADAPEADLVVLDLELGGMKRGRVIQRLAAVCWLVAAGYWVTAQVWSGSARS